MSDASGSTDTGDDGDADKAADAKQQSDTDKAPDWQAEAEKWKALSRQHEKASRNAAGELDKLRKASMTEQEKAVAEAVAKGKSEAFAEFGQRLVEAEVRAAAAGRGIDADALLEGLDRSRFVDAEGEPDRKAIEAYLDRLAPKQAKRLDLGQGARDGVDHADMNSMLRRATGR
jgi:hypothetical protein